MFTIEIDLDTYTNFSSYSKWGELTGEVQRKVDPFIWTDIAVDSEVTVSNPYWTNGLRITRTFRFESEEHYHWWLLKQ